jgi:hypothetical protein
MVAVEEAKMTHRLGLVLALLGLLAAGCGGRTVGGTGNHAPDGGVDPVDARPDASIGSPIVFVRGQGPTPGLHAIRPDGSGRLVVPIEYRHGMCACACLEEPPPPEETPLGLVLIDVHMFPSVRALSHNGACTPAFSPDGEQVAFCDNELHILPMPGGYLYSGISVHDIAANTTTAITDETHFDTHLDWVE